MLPLICRGVFLIDGSVKGPYAILVNLLLFKMSLFKPTYNKEYSRSITAKIQQSLHILES